MLITCLKNPSRAAHTDFGMGGDPERDPHPRCKSWKVTVPYACKSLMENESFYPSGWSHRKYFPKRFQGDRNVRPHLDPADPVNIEIAARQGSGGSPRSA